MNAFRCEPLLSTIDAMSVLDKPSVICPFARDASSIRFLRLTLCIFQDVLMNLAKAVANAAAMLVLKAKNVAQVAEDAALQNRVISAATQCALSTSQLVACAKVLYRSAPPPPPARLSGALFWGTARGRCEVVRCLKQDMFVSTHC